MVALDMVRLRSKYPNTGRMTVRYAMPRIYGPIDGPVADDLDDALRQVLSDEAATTADDSTTPQVDLTEQVLVETGAGKGGTAR